VNSLPKTVVRERRGCYLNPGPSAPESSTLTTRLPSLQYTDSKRPHRCCRLPNATSIGSSVSVELDRRTDTHRPPWPRRVCNNRPPLYYMACREYSTVHRRCVEREMKVRCGSAVPADRCHSFVAQQLSQMNPRDGIVLQYTERDDQCDKLTVDRRRYWPTTTGHSFRSERPPLSSQDHNTLRRSTCCGEIFKVQSSGGARR